MAKRPMPNLPGIFRVAYFWTFGGIRAQNVFHVSSSSPTAAGVFSALNTAQTAAMWGQTTTEATITNVQIYNLGDQSAAFEQVPTGAQWAGAAAPGQVQLAPAVVVSLGTDQRGPSNRGRLFLPFVSEEVAGNGQLDATVLTSLQAAWNAFRLALPSSGSSLHVTSYGIRDEEGVFLPGKEAHSNPVLTTLVHSSLGTQRMRQARTYS